jgi:hypothetical protein
MRKQFLKVKMKIRMWIGVVIRDTRFRFMVPCIVFQYVNVPNLMSLYINLF